MDEALASWQAKIRLVEERVAGVAKGYATGLYLWGEGGTSKTHTVVETLARLRVPFQLTNTHLTARGLFDRLREGHDQVHVVDDVGAVLGGGGVCRVLLAALDTKAERVVTWGSSRGEGEFVFEGGVILVANHDLDGAAQLRALKGRISKHHHQPTHRELVAVMRVIAEGGYEHKLGSLSAGQCEEVLEVVLARSRALRRALDLRLLVNGFHDRLQFENGDSTTHWETLLEARMREGAVKETRAGKKAGEVSFLRGLPPGLSREERFKAWREATGKSEQAMYRRLKELESEKVRTNSQILTFPAPNTNEGGTTWAT